jgi:hypothetical protein
LISPSALITQQQDPIVAIEKELKIKLDADAKEALRTLAANEPSYQGKVKIMLDHLKKDKFKGNYKALKQIENMEPLYNLHDFWDSQPVPKAYDKVDESMFDKPIDVVKTVADVKPEPYPLPAGY